MNIVWKTIKHKIFPKMVAYTGKYSLKLLLKTCRFEFDGLDTFKELGSKERCIVGLWHNRLILAAEILTTYAPDFQYAALISQSRDGEILSTIAESYSVGRSIRIPHDAKLAALNKAINHIRYAKEIIVVTPDGPRGPRYKIKAGLVHTAKTTGAHIVPMSWTPNKFWQLGSWDKMIFPKPFSTIHVVFGASIILEKTEGSPTDEEIGLVEEKLNVTNDKSCANMSDDRSLWPK